MPLIQPSDFLPISCTLYFPQRRVSLQPFIVIRQPTDYSFANPRLWGMRLWAGQSSCPSIRSRYTSSPTSRRSPPSRRRRFVHINASKVLPARGVDCAARGPARASRLSNLLAASSARPLILSAPASAGARARTRTNTRRAHARVLAPSCTCLRAGARARPHSLHTHVRVHSPS